MAHVEISTASAQSRISAYQLWVLPSPTAESLDVHRSRQHSQLSPIATHHDPNIYQSRAGSVPRAGSTRTQRRMRGRRNR